MSARGERIGFLALAVLAFVYVALRAAWVPLTHDEAATFQTYVLTGRYLPFLSHWDAGNHLLITAIGRATYLLFGPQPLALRSFSVLCFALQAWYVWRITRTLHTPIVRWCASAALVLSPFLLDFHSMFRGYGPSLAFLLMAVHHMVRYTEEGGSRHAVAAALGISLAILSSLTLLIVACMVIGLLGWYLFKRDRKEGPAFGAWLILGVLPLSFAALYGKGLSDRGLLYFGSEAGILRGTLPSLVKWVIGADNEKMGVLVGIVLSVLVLILFVRGMRARSSVIIVLGALIFSEMLGRFVLGEFFGVLYPMDRTAMHLVPLVILLLAFGLDHWSAVRPRMSWAALLFLWLPLRTIAGVNLDHTTYWPEQAIPDEVFRLVAGKQQLSDRPLLIGGYRQNPRAWAYGASIRGLDLNFLDDTGFPQATCDGMIIDPTYFEAPPGFHTVFTAPHGRLAFMERTIALRDSVEIDTTWSIAQGNEEFTGLLAPPVESLRGREWLIEVDAIVHSLAIPLELRLVVEAKDPEGRVLHYDVIDIEDLRALWKAERLHVLRRLPRFDVPASHVAIYFWNPGKATFRADSLRVRVHEVLSVDT